MARISGEHRSWKSTSGIGRYVGEALRAGKRRTGMDLIAALLSLEATRFHPVRAKAPLANAHSLSEISPKRSQNSGETTPGA